MANLGSSLASYFSVFHRLLTNRLKQVPQADAALLQSLAAELKVEHKSSCQDCSPLTAVLQVVQPHSLCCCFLLAL